MPRSFKAYVLDSWAIIALLSDEPDGEKVAQLIADANDSRIPILVSVVSVGEVWYLVAESTTPAEADRRVGELKNLGINFEDATWPSARQAAEFRSRYKWSLADCFSASLAKETKGGLVTGNRPFQPAEKDITIVWIN
jgi:predicted nucleic acid-binding protein